MFGYFSREWKSRGAYKRKGKERSMWNWEEMV